MTNLNIAKLYLATNTTATATEIDAAIADGSAATAVTALTGTTLLNAIYQASFGRDADAEGLAYWGASTLTGDALVTAINAGAAVYVANDAYPENVAIAANDTVVVAAKTTAEAAASSASVGSVAAAVVTVVDTTTATAAITTIDAADAAADAAAAVAAAAAATATYDAAVVVYDAAVVTAAASKTAADTAAAVNVTTATVANATASKTAATTANTDAAAVVAAADAVVSAATATAATADDGTSAATKVLADAALVVTAALVATATAAVTDATIAAAAAAAVGTTYDLTADRDLLTTMTEKGDTVNAEFGALNASDVVGDDSVVDSDTLNAVVTLATGNTFSAIKIETINLDVRAIGDTIVNMTNVEGTNTLNLLSNYSLAASDIDVLNTESGLTIDVASSMNMGATDTLLVTASSDIKTSAATVNMNADSFIIATQSATTNDIDLLTINSGGTAANTVTLAAANSLAYTTLAADRESLTITGDQDLTIKATDGVFDSALLSIVDSTTAGTTTLELTQVAVSHAAEDLTHVDVDVISLIGTVGTDDAFTVSSGTRIDLDATLGAPDLVINTANLLNTDYTLDLNVDVSQAGVSGIALTEFNTVNLGNTSTAATAIGGALTLSVGGIGETAVLNVATGLGLTISGATTAAAGTLTEVNVTGAYNFVNTGVITATEISLLNEGDQTLTGAVTGNVTSAVSALKTFLVTGALTGTLDTSGAGDVSIAAGGGDSTGAVTLLHTGDTAFGNDVIGAVTATVADTKTLTVANDITGDLIIDGAGDLAVTNDITGDVTSTLSGATTVGNDITGNADFTLTDATVVGVELTVTNDVTGNLILSGSGDASIGNDVTGDLTVNGSVNATVVNQMDGDLTVTGSGDVEVTTDLVGSVIAGSATGDITVTAAGTQSGTITTGSGDDTITLVAGDNAVTVITNAGNDVIDITAVTDAVSVDAGAGVDTITSGTLADELTGGTGTDTFVMIDATATDIITDFTFGLSGDVLNVASLTTGATNNLAGTSVSVASSTAKVTTAAEAVIAVTDVVAADWSDILTIMDAAITSATTEDAYILVSNGTDARVYEMIEAGTDSAITVADTMTVVATLSGVTTADFADIVDSNFVVA